MVWLDYLMAIPHSSFFHLSSLPNKQMPFFVSLWNMLEHSSRSFFKMTNKSINSHRIASSIDDGIVMAPITYIILYIYIVIENERHNEQHYSINNNNNNKDLLCDRHESSHGVWRIGGNDCQGSVN